MSILSKEPGLKAAKVLDQCGGRTSGLPRNVEIVQKQDVIRVHVEDPGRRDRGCLSAEIVLRKVQPDGVAGTRRHGDVVDEGTEALALVKAWMIRDFWLERRELRPFIGGEVRFCRFSLLRYLAGFEEFFFGRAMRRFARGFRFSGQARGTEPLRSAKGKGERL